MITKVAKTCFWMAHYQAETPKRHYVFSNSQKILPLDKGKLDRSTFQTKKQTVIKYHDKNNVARYKGSEHLRGTELLALHLAAHVLVFI